MKTYGGVVNGGIILKLILPKTGVREWSGFILIQTEPDIEAQKIEEPINKEQKLTVQNMSPMDSKQRKPHHVRNRNMYQIITLSCNCHIKYVTIVTIN
jgi:tRNA U54 and U55 pseudouridine synthase Pus10